MIKSLYFANSGVSEFDENSRLMTKDFLPPKEIKLEMALIKEYSKSVELTAIEPTDIKNLSENCSIENIPFLIPTKETIENFIHRLKDRAYIEWEGIHFDTSIDRDILDFLVTIIQNNMLMLLKDKRITNRN